MAKKRTIYIPTGIAGLPRFLEEERELIRLKPEHVVYVVIGVIIFELMLKLFG